MDEQSAFESLAPFVKEFVYRNGWQELRQIQIEAINSILRTQADILITTGTASGKTEAAFLPILSSICNKEIDSVRVLYVGPLKALLNDQFRRLEPICEMGNIPIFRWHGDVAISNKKNLIENPGGVLQITPESIESLLINRTKYLDRLFRGLEFIVIDEVHTFLDSDRGIQLQSQLERLSKYCVKRPRRIGLSATIGDVNIAKKWINPLNPSEVVLIDPTVSTPPTRLSHLHFINSDIGVSAELVDDLYSLTRNRKSLIFCNSRRYVEQVTTELNRLCRRDNVEERYLPHHGSISKEIREDAELKMRNQDRPFSVVSTSTLELGIDIGHLELIVQIDSTHSVMSFVQRLGRTGRSYGTPRIMQIYSSELSLGSDKNFYERIPFSLLKAIEIVNLFLQGWVEPSGLRQLPYHILYHQILSLLIENDGASPHSLVTAFYRKGVFSDIPEEDYEILLRHMLSIDHIEQLDSGEMILGLQGERIARSRDFYAVFQTPPEWDVMYGEKTIGRISPSLDLLPGVSLILGGCPWVVATIHPDQKRVMVKKTSTAHDVLFEGSDIPEMHQRVSQEVQKILTGSQEPSYLSKTAITRLRETRQFSIDIKLLDDNFVEVENFWFFFPWTGSKIARTLNLLIKHSGFQSEFPNSLFPWVLKIKRPDQKMSWETFLQNISETAKSLEDVSVLIKDVPDQVLRLHKFDQYIPTSLIRKRAATEWIDWQGVKDLLKCLTQMIQ